MKYLLVDTNNLVYITLLTSKGEDRKVFESFKNALDNGELKLLLPEVVKLEYSRKTTEGYEVLGRSIGKIKVYIKKEMQKDEISLGDRVVKEIDEALDKILKERRDRSKKVKKKVLGLFEHHNTIQIPITDRLLSESVKYSLEGKKPFDPNIKNYLQPDVLLVLATSLYVRDNKIENLIICSNDLAAFSKTEKVNSPTYEPNDDIAALFPNLDRCYRFLTDLLNEELQSAIDKEKLTIPESYLTKIMEQQNIMRRAAEQYASMIEKNKEAIERVTLPIRQAQQNYEQMIADYSGWSHEMKDNKEGGKG